MIRGLKLNYDPSNLSNPSNPTNPSNPFNPFNRLMLVAAFAMNVSMV